MYSLANAIIQEDIRAVQQLVRYEDVNAIDVYGFTPLIEALLPIILKLHACCYRLRRIRICRV